MSLTPAEWKEIEAISFDYSEENAAQNPAERGHEVIHFDGQLMPRREVYALVSGRLEAAGIRASEVAHAANRMAYGGNGAPEDGEP